jgi:phage-related baseplate assembly protein
MADPFANLPEISFVNTDVQQLQNAVVQAFQDMWLADTGETLILTQADRRYSFLLSLVAYLVQERELIDASARQNLLPYATGGFLDSLAALYGPRANRLPPAAAQTTMQFTLSTLLNTEALIPAGTQIASTDAGGLVFATNSDLTIPIGSGSGTVTASCLSTGTIGNGILPNVITNLLNWNSPYAVAATNLETTAGGADIETDEAYRRRIFLVTQSYSNAGSYGAYEFFALSASSSIAEVTVSGPEDGLQPGNVLVTVLLQNGELPNQAILDLVYAAVNPDTIRDLCAQVTVQGPQQVPYSVWASYYIDLSQANRLVQIQSDILTAVQAWIDKNKMTLAGSINPSSLTVAMMNAGASYVMISNPAHVVLTKQQVPALVNDATIVYLGTEGDLP